MAGGAWDKRRLSSRNTTSREDTRVNVRIGMTKTGVPVLKGDYFTKRSNFIGRRCKWIKTIVTRAFEQDCPLYLILDKKIERTKFQN